MEWKRIGKRLLYPPVWLVIILLLVSSVSLAGVFIRKKQESAIAYIVYVLSFYTLTVLSVLMVKVLPPLFRKTKNKVTENRYANLFLNDAAFSTRVKLYASFAVNLLYACFNMISQLIYRSVWFGVLAGYYGTLALMRFLLLRYVRTGEMGSGSIKEYKISRICGVILMSLNLVLSGAVLMIMYRDKGYEYNGILIYIMAMYTFYVTVHSVKNVVKYSRKSTPVQTTAMFINLSAALVSMLSLETAMLNAFGGNMLPENRRIFIAATGAGVSVTVVAMSVYLIVAASKGIKKNRGNKNG